MSENIKITPMIQQYLDIKEDYADAIVFFRLGDFYEMFFDDAKIASQVLDITLTSRHKESNIPMCGIPFHASVLYIQKLIKEGFSVAIAEQVTEPGKGLIERKVTRLITPGTVLEGELLEPSVNNYIAGLSVTETQVGLSFFDMSTGQGQTYDCQSLSNALNLMSSFDVKEIIMNIELDVIKHIRKKVLKIPKTYQRQASQHVDGHLKESIHLILFYVEDTQQHPVEHVLPFEVKRIQENMHVESHVIAHLDIFHPEKKQSLMYYLNQTQTSMGSRLLNEILKTPSKNLDHIQTRLNDIETLMNRPKLLFIHEAFSSVYDVYRLLQRFMYHRANPKDIIQLKKSLIQIQHIYDLMTSNQLFINKMDALKMDETLISYLDKSIVNDPPTNILEGGFIKRGFNETLDTYIDSLDSQQAILDAYLLELKTITSIKNIKIGYQRLTGYYIEISKIYVDQLESFDFFHRKQTLKNVERYTTDKLKNIETRFLEAETQKLTLEQNLFHQIVSHIHTHYFNLLEASKLVAYFDVVFGLATYFRKNDYNKPVFNQNRQIILKRARHPIVEKHTRYIHNDIHLNDKHHMMLITGPNMSGKSTYMRMIAIIAYMAQCGLYVPAQEANLPVYDAIFTRLGASDDISKGMSTFMTEMVETNHALQVASKDSLLLFDEIGRGTSTYDGMALAQGILEYIHDDISCHTLFSTHYHEMTQLEHHLKGLENYHVAAKKQTNHMIFLHKVKPGKSDKSYGIAVASLAKIPEKIIERSKIILKSYEAIQQKENTDLFTYQDLKDTSSKSSLIEGIKAIDIDSLTPLEALKKLAEIQSKLEDDDGEY
ncbi:MAG: DNA mismatch repair protein MutS [Acholeplasmataceae bacterium]